MLFTLPPILWWGLIGLFFTALLLFHGILIVHQQSVALIERLGRFVRIAGPGISFRIPFIERVSGVISLRLSQMDVAVETKSKDNVFVHVMISVQYRILAEKVYEAFYTFEDAESQIRAYVFDVIRARIPHIHLDDVFSRKDDIAMAVESELRGVMQDFGYDIMKALVTDIHPDEKVKSAMNEINEAQRLRCAALERAEAEKILKIKQAEADSESKILQGQGLAGQRKAIAAGMKEALELFQSDLPGTNTQDIMHLMILSQYFDTLKELGNSGKTNTIFLPHSPEGLHQFQDQLRNAMLAAGQVAKPGS